MEEEKSLGKRLAKMPYPVIALGVAGIFTGAAYFFVYLAKFLSTIPRDFDLPWLFIFVLVFLLLLVRKRLRTVRMDGKPPIS